MRIVLDATTLDGAPSGAATRLSALAAVHRDQDLVHLVAPGCDPLPGYPCHEVDLGAGPVARALSGRRLDRLLTRLGADLYMAAALPLPRVTACPVVVTVHDLRHRDRRGGQGPLRRLWGRAGLAGNLRRAAAVVAVSRTTARRLVEEVGVEAGRVHVVPNAPSPELPLDPGLDAVARFRRRFDLNRRYVLGIGGLGAHKGWTTLLAGLAALRARPGCGDVGLVLAGRADPARGLALAREAASLGLDDGARLVGVLSPGDLAAALAGAEALVSPGESEGFALPVVDAQVRGVPVVASRAGAHPEVVGEGGWLVEPGDPGALAEALEAVLGGGPGVEARVEAGRRAGAAWSWEASARVLEALWLRVG